MLNLGLDISLKPLGIAGEEVDPDLTLHQDFTKSSLASAAVLGPTLSFSRASEATYFDASGVMQTAASGALRLGAHVFNGSAWVNRGALIENSGTNECLRSEEFDDAVWIKTSATITPNAATALDGSVTADRYESDADGSSLDQTVAVTQPGLNFSIFVKAETAQFLHLRAVSNYGFGSESWFDLSSGSFLSFNNIGPPFGLSGVSLIKDMGDGWYRCSILPLNANLGSVSSWTVSVRLADADGSDTEVEDESILVWGAQVEAFTTLHSQVSSYIPTEGSAVTREQDLLGTTDVTWFNDDEGTFVCEGLAPAEQGVNMFAFHMDDGTATDRLGTYVAPSPDDFHSVSTHSSDDDGALVTTPDYVYGDPFKVALAYADDDFIMAFDGGLSAADNSAAFPLADAMTNLRVGTDNDASDWLNGYVTDLKYYEVRKANTFLQSETM